MKRRLVILLVVSMLLVACYVALMRPGETTAIVTHIDGCTWVGVSRLGGRGATWGLTYETSRNKLVWWYVSNATLDYFKERNWPPLQEFLDSLAY